VRITYTAKRKIASGHTAGNSYTLDMLTTEAQRTLVPRRKTNEALDSSEENVLLNIKSLWSVTTDQYKRSGSAPTARDLLEEFFASVMAGELFVFDPYRLPSGGADVLPMNCTLVDGPFDSTPIDGGVAVYTTSFTVREVSPIT
jgi:hypothetical protein